MAEVVDRWRAGSTYEHFMGRWSRELAREFVAWLGVAEELLWLDVGCGTGALAGAIRKHALPSRVVACDPATALIDYARGQLQDRRVTFVVGNAETLPFRPRVYGCAASLLALNFFSDPEAGLRNMRDATIAGGVIAACVWDYGAGMEFLRRFWDVAVTLDPSARSYDEGVRFPLCEPEQLKRLFLTVGLADVRCDAIEISTPFASFEDYWRPFLGGTGPAPSYVASLDADRQKLLERELAGTLSVDPVGRFALRARAWAIQGVKSDSR